MFVTAGLQRVEARKKKRTEKKNLSGVCVHVQWLANSVAKGSIDVGSWVTMAVWKLESPSLSGAAVRQVCMRGSFNVRKRKKRSLWRTVTVFKSWSVVSAGTRLVETRLVTSCQ